MAHKYMQLCKTVILSIFLCLFVSSCVQNEEIPATIAGYTTLEDLDGHTVGVVAGSTMDVMLSDTDNFPNITLLRVKTPAQLISLIEHDSADCGITDTIQLMAHKLEQHGLAVDFNLPGGYDVAAAFNLSNEKLCSQFNDFLVQVKSDGTLDSIFSRWSSYEMDTVVMPDMPELAELKGRPIEVATLSENPPFSFYRNNKWTGIEVELVLRFSLFIQRPVHFSGYTFDEILGILQSHKAEMATATIFITPDRSSRILYSTPYYFCKTSCFSLAR